MGFLYGALRSRLETIWGSVPPERCSIKARNPERGPICVKTRQARAGSTMHDQPHFAPWSIRMFDLVMLAIGLAFFALSVGYAYVCEQL